MVERYITQRIVEDLTFFPVVGIVGPRQVGKTTLAKILSKRLDQEVIYLDLELNSDKTRLQDAESYLKKHTEKCVIIDEIQHQPSLFNLLRALIDIDRRPARFIILGSASPRLIVKSADTLAGRIAYHELSPFGWHEIKTLKDIETHWLRGGFPEAFLAPNPVFTFRWLGNFINTFIKQDLSDLGYEVVPATLSKFVDILAHLNANILNTSDISRSLGISIPTINKYIDLLEGSYLIRTLPAFSTNIGKRLVKSPKVYIRDSGILHQLMGVQDAEQLLGHPAVGASWESYVIEQITRKTTDDWKMYYYRTHQGAEVDLLLITPQQKRICIEIKLSNSPTVSKGFYQSMSDLDVKEGFVIIPTAESYEKNDGIKVINLTDFLSQLYATLSDEEQ